jgi:glutamate-ammonia-ligase adenylyltransferase
LRDRLTTAAGATFAPMRASRSLQHLAESSRAAFETLADCEPSLLEKLAELLVLSPPMLDALARHPEWISGLATRLRDPFTERPIAQSTCEENWTEHQSGTGIADSIDRLRAFKRREYLEIALLDISGISSFEETIRRLSRLADFVISTTLSCSWLTLAGQRPASIGDSATPEGFAVFALGKLGGDELNYSSDVDLIFFWRGSDDTDELRFVTRLGERLVSLLSQPGADGPLYRVDMRLRPYGNSGPLVPSVANLISYYESWGEAWERQALIKARFVTGDHDLGRRFSDFVEKYTYARQMDDSSLEEIKRVKHRSEKEHALKADLKQGAGGIRDIEFYVQYLQLIAGHEHAVRVRGTLEAIARLAAARFLLEGEESQLSLAYRFLRIVEHRLQLRGLTFRSLVPEDSEELALLAKGLGFGGSDLEATAAFRSTLQLHRSRVRAILERIYLTAGYLYLKGYEQELAQLLSDRIPKDRVRELLSQYGFRDIEKAWQNIRLIALGPSGRMLPPGERRAFLEFAFTLLELLRDTIDPDLALHHLESFAASTGNRISFLRTLATRRPHLTRLANLLAHSNLCQQILTRHPEYFDSLAQGTHILEGRNWEDMYQEIQDRFGRSPRGETKEDLIRKFRQREMVRIAYRDLAGLADALEIGKELSNLAEACLKAASLIAQSDVEAQTDLPQPALRIAALGKLGSRQLHYASDLDLIFLYEEPEGVETPERRARIHRVQDERVEKVVQLLAGVTSEGVGYHLDLRLRPEGSAGVLARSWTSFADYAHQSMQPWERMALVRCRMLDSSDELLSRWNVLLAEIIYEFQWDEEALESIRHLKKRIEAEKSRESQTHLDFKYGKGGIADLEFLVQFLQLLHGKNEEAVRTPSVPEAILALEGVEALSSEEARSLLAAHRFHRLVENHYQLMEEWGSREISRESPQLVRLARSIGIPPQTPSAVRNEFLAQWEHQATNVRMLVEKYFYRV